MPRMSDAELEDILEEEDVGTAKNRQPKKKQKKIKQVPKFRKDRDLYT